MTANSATTLGKKLGDINDAHGDSGASVEDSFRVVRPRTGFHVVADAAWQNPITERTPFEQLKLRFGRPLKVAILSDFTRIPYANGAAFQTRFLYQELKKAGHEVTIIGPHDPDARPGEVPAGTVELPSMPLRMYPGVRVPMPLEAWVYDPSRWEFDLVFAQTTSLLMQFGVWLREMLGIPLLCVNTTHLAAAYEVLLPESLGSARDLVRRGVDLTLARPYERLFAGIYNSSDGLVVLSEGLRTYWRERGVTAPIHVIPRAVQPEVFGTQLGDDPYAAIEGMPDGPRLLCAGRHTREKSQDRVIRIFAEYILPKSPNASLTLLGKGPDTEFYKRVARDCGVAHRVFFPGEAPFTRMVDFYAYCDLFLHGSLSETYGNVLGEALWCGTPTVAFADGMGASSQIKNGVSGLLVDPGSRSKVDAAAADSNFGAAVLGLLEDEVFRAQLSLNAAKLARARSAPLAVQTRLADAFLHAHDKAKRSGLKPRRESLAPMRWYTTAKYFGSWMGYNGGAVAAGYMRRAQTLPNIAQPAIDE